MTTKLNPKFIENVIALHLLRTRPDLSYKQIAAEAFISYWRVRYIAKEFELPRRQAGRKKPVL